MIRSDETRERILKMHAEAIQRAEAEIDKAILASEDLDGEVVAVVYVRLHKVAVDRLVDYYSGGGWHVTADFHPATDQRDDDRVTFRLRPRHEANPPVVAPSPWPTRKHGEPFLRVDPMPQPIEVNGAPAIINPQVWCGPSGMARSTTCGP